MSHKIFLSHNHADKPIVEPVAVRLAGIFGVDQVFYDSWSSRVNVTLIMSVAMTMLPDTGEPEGHQAWRT